MDDPVYTLIQQTRSPDSDTQQRSAHALGTSDLSEYRLQAIQALCKLLKHEQLPVRETAKNSLIQIGGAEVVKALIPYLKGRSSMALNYAIEILSQIGGENIDCILRLLESKDHDIRKFGCDILGNLHYTDGVYELIDLLNDPHINVAIAAGEALGKLGSREAVPHLIRALQYPDSWMRCIAAEALGKIGDVRAVDAFLEIPYDEEPIVLYTMIKAMGNLHDIRILPYILSLLKLNAKFASSVIQAIEQLLEFCGSEVYEVIKQADVGMNFVQVLSTESLDVLLSAIRLIGKLQYKEAVPSLKRLLCHADKMVVTESISALKQIERPADIRPMLEQALGETIHSQGKHILQRALNEFENNDILS